MRRPKTVTVFGKAYSVEWDSRELDEMVCGDHHQKKNVIRIAPDMGPDEERETLLHELTHAMSDQIGMNISEAKVRQLSVAFYALCHANPKLRAYLFTKAKS
jgi:hypothetical protein